MPIDPAKMSRAAKYLGCPPSELPERPMFWIERALKFESVEAEAEQKKKGDKRAD